MAKHYNVTDSGSIKVDPDALITLPEAQRQILFCKQIRESMNNISGLGPTYRDLQDEIIKLRKENAELRYWKEFNSEGNLLLELARSHAEITRLQNQIFDMMGIPHE